MNLRIVLLLLTLAVSSGSCEKQRTINPPSPPEVAYVTVEPERILLTEELPARVVASLVAEIRPEVSGIIKRHLFVEGSDVKQGEVLYEIEDASYRVAYENAQASLKRAEATLPSLRSKVERYKELVEINAISRQEYEDTLSALRQLEADIEYFKGAVEAQRINLERTRIRAPIDGRIGKSNVTIGALVVAYQQAPLATIQRLDPIYVDATQSTAAWLKLKRQMETGFLRRTNPEGATVRLLLEDGRLYPWRGRFKFSDVTVDPTTGSFTLRMVFPNPDHTLLPGTYVRTILEEGVVENGILVPQQAVQRDIKGRPMVMVVDEKGEVEPRLVELDRTVGDKWLVAKGLRAKERVVVEGLQRIRPGLRVKPVPLQPEKG